MDDLDPLALFRACLVAVAWTAFGFIAGVLVSALVWSIS